MTRYSQGSLRNAAESNYDESDRASTPRQSGYLERSASYTSSSSSVTGSETTRTSRSGSYSDLSSRSGDYRDSKYSIETRVSTTSSLVQREIHELEDMVYKCREQLELYKRRADDEKRRADDAVAKAQEIAEHLKKVNEARIIAQREASKANEELRCANG